MGCLAVAALAALEGIGALVHFEPWKKDVQLTEAERAAKAQPAAATTETATKDAPFVNTLGMKFVPVPGTGVLSVSETRVKDRLPAGREPEHPVYGVSWEDAKTFCEWLMKKEPADGGTTFFSKSSGSQAGLL